MNHSESLESIQPHGPTILIIADGWSRSVFLDLLSEGKLPEIDEGIISAGGLLSNVVSNLPSVSLASHASLLTGSFQDEHCVPGHRWMDPASGEITNYLSLRHARRVNPDMSKSVSTVFEANPNTTGIAIQSVISRGASSIWRIPTIQSGPILGLTARAAIAQPNSTIVSWLPRGDARAHRSGPESTGVARDMIATSRSLGRLLGKLAGKKLLDRSRIVLVPDHGQRKAQYSTHLGKVLTAAGISAEVNPKMQSSEKHTVLTSGDSAAYIYLRRGGHGEREAVVEQLAAHPDVELLCWAEDSELHFRNALGHATAEPIDVRQGNVAYRRLTDHDPLGLLDDAETAELIDLSEPMLDRGHYPDILHQYLRSHVAGRSGDVLVLSGRDSHFGLGFRVGYRLGFHRGTHGGPFSEEMVVSAVHRGFGEIPDVPTRSADLLKKLSLIRPLSDRMLL